MAEFYVDEEKVIGIGDPIILDKKTDPSFEVSAGIVFRKSGIYEVSIVGSHTIVSKVSERKIGKWIKDDFTGIIKCDQCGNDASMDTTGGGQYKSNFCPTCGADMRGDDNG